MFNNIVYFLQDYVAYFFVFYAQLKYKIFFEHNHTNVKIFDKIICRNNLLTLFEDLLEII